MTRLGQILALCALFTLTTAQTGCNPPDIDCESVEADLDYWVGVAAEICTVVEERARCELAHQMVLGAWWLLERSPLCEAPPRPAAEGMTILSDADLAWLENQARESTATKRRAAKAYRELRKMTEQDRGAP